MRLIGFSLRSESGPVTQGYLDLDDVTVLIGANDAGKSRFAQGMVTGLRRVDRRPRERSGFFVDLPEGIDDLFRELHDASTRSRTEAPRRARPIGSQSTSQSFADDARRADGPEGREAWVQHLADARDGAEWATVLDALRSSTLLHVALDEDEDPQSGDEPRWLISWCLPPRSSLEEPVISAARSLGLFAPAHPPAAPVLVCPIGRTAHPPLPKVSSVPIGAEDLGREMAIAVARVATLLDELRRWTVDHALGSEPRESELSSVGSAFRQLGDRLDAVELAPAPAWVATDADGQRMGVAEGVVRTAAMLSHALASALPRFISSHYEVRVRPANITEWPDELIAIEMRRRGSPDFFPAAALAEGFRTWLQISILEALNSVRQAERSLLNTAAAVWDASSAYADALDVDLPALTSERERAQSEGEVAAAARATEAIHVARERIERSAATLPMLAESLGLMTNRFWADGTLPPPMSRGLSFTTSDETGARRAERENALRVYFIDEPERNLHPRLQRQAASWLLDTMRVRGSQAIIATHSVPFMSLSGATHYSYLSRRPDGTSEVSGMEASELTALSDAAKDLGLDRGELLGRVTAILFVEGRADQRLLEALFSDRLHSIGALVVPTQGSGKVGQLFESELLFKYTRAPLAMMMDNLGQEELDSLTSDPQYLEEALRSKKTELQAMASLVKNATVFSRQVEPLAIPVADIFDLLDEQELRAQYPDFPGHEAAMDKYRKLTRKTPHNRKVIYEQHFGVPRGPDVYGAVGERMRRRGIYPNALVEVIDAVERMAVAADSGDLAT